MPAGSSQRRASGSGAGTSSGAGFAARSSSRPNKPSRVPADALALTLAAAVLHAAWNVLLRGSDDGEARTAAVLPLSALVFAPVAAATGSGARSAARDA